MRASICIYTPLLFHTHAHLHHIDMYACFNYSVMIPYNLYTLIVIRFCVPAAKASPVLTCGADGKPLKPISQPEYEALYIQTSSLRDWSRSG